jgi:UDP-glucose:(heptosyl)LPS alpha-1,3-glucosyltransferase
MRLAFCLFKYFPFGGLQRDFLAIAKLCLQRHHIVDVYTMEWQGEYEPGLKIHIIPMTAVLNHTRRVAFYQNLKPLLVHNRFDAIIAFDKMPGVDFYYAADKSFKTKAYTSRSWLYRLTPRYRSSIQLESAVFNPNGSTHIFALSRNQQDEYIHAYGTSPKRFTILPPGIDKSRAAPNNAAAVRQTLRSQYALTPSQHLVLFVGSGFKTKGLDRALLAFARLPNSILLRSYFFIIGKDHKESFSDLATSLKIKDRVLFLGGRDNISEFMLSADVLIHPAYHENTGTVILEAIISGLPVLTTEVCGYAEYVKKANCGLVLKSPFDQDICDYALQRMLTSPEWTTWQKNGIQFGRTANLYSSAHVVTHAIEAFKAGGIR